MYAANDIRCGEYDLAVAGGMESMSNAPYALTQARTGYRMGNGKMIDVMIHDGLWDPYGDKHMGNCAETCVAKYHFTREQQDEFSLRVVPPRAGRHEDGQVQEGDRRRRDRREEGEVGRRRRRGAVRRPARQDGDRSSRRSRRTAARSPPRTRRRSTTAPPRWS